MAMVFPQDRESEEAETVAETGEPGTGDGPVAERHDRCVAAVRAGDVAAVRTMASRVILDLARGGANRKIVELYQLIGERMTRVPLTDAALGAAATSAIRLGDEPTYIAIVGTLLEQHPGSSYAPRLMWKLAELYRNADNDALELETLRELSTRFRRDPLGVQAAEELERRGKSVA
ncbi:MAG: tol-pal system YbgF family protein [Kofleriaceae bacterium]